MVASVYESVGASVLEPCGCIQGRRNSPPVAASPLLLFLVREHVKVVSGLTACRGIRR
jgi:hypothetical protein